MHTRRRLATALALAAVTVDDDDLQLAGLLISVHSFYYIVITNRNFVVSILGAQVIKFTFF